MKKTSFGLIVGSREFFNPELARQGRNELISKINKMGYDYVVLAEDDTLFGVVQNHQDAKKCAELFQKNASEIDGIIVCLPNFGDESSISAAIKYSGLNVPILVMACDDELDKMELQLRRDAFCGKISVCNNFIQQGIRFTDTTLHTCSIDSIVFTGDIRKFEKVCRVVNGMKNLRIAQIGARISSFQTVRYSEKILQNSGITVIPADISVIINKADAISTCQEVIDVVNQIKNYAGICRSASDEQIIRSTKLKLAISQWMSENDCQAGTLACWPEIEKHYGCAPCLAMSLLGEEGIPMSCETDVMGAVTMYAMYLASGIPTGYMDWNNNYGDDRNKCIAIHCSNFPKSFVNGNIDVSYLDILGNALGKDICFGAIKARVCEGNMTFAKITTDDINGKIKMYIGQGEFTDDPIDTAGGVAICKIDKLQKLMKYICCNGFEHHVAMSRGNVEEILCEALGNYSGFQIYRHPKAD